MPISIVKQYLSSTDANGHFTLKYAKGDKEDVSLFFQYIGFKSQTVRIKRRKDSPAQRNFRRGYRLHKRSYNKTPQCVATIYSVFKKDMLYRKKS